MVRARLPDREGDVSSGGVAIHYEVHGSGSPTVLLVPPSPITHAQIWKTLLPHLARRNRVVTFDGRGNGRSGRPTAIEDHTRAANVADIVAVLDATGTQHVVVVTLCDAAWWALDLIAGHPERVVGFVAIEPGMPHLGGPQAHWAAAVETWDEHLEDPQGWQLFNRHAITTSHRRWVEFFFDAQLVEPHSTRTAGGRGRLGARVDGADPRGERGGPRPRHADEGRDRRAVPRDRGADARRAR